MPRFMKRISKKAGLPPGTLVHIGEKKTEEVRINLIDYDEGHFQETEIETIEECFPFKDRPSVTWINIDGLHQVDVIERLGTHFDIHPLVLEDIMHTGQRPKAEDFEEYIFFVLKMLYYDEKGDQVKAEQVSLFWVQIFSFLSRSKKETFSVLSVTELETARVVSERQEVITSHTRLWMPLLINISSYWKHSEKR